MGTPIRVLGIAGSLRMASLNKATVRAAAELAPAGMTLDSFDLADIPFYNSDVEAEGFPLAVAALREAIALADGVLWVTPEYNFSTTGVLKNAIDWASRPPNTPLNGKPAAITGAGGRLGTARAQYHLRHIFQHSNLLVLNTPEVFIMRAREKFDDQGNLTDPETRQQLEELLVAFAAWIRRLKSV